ncbi:MAG TPA: ribosome assembly cofactor RimP [Spirochaetia bacterium]|nr:ribosome assembly cofactor RimP [Spirochaetia bacterium]
MAVVRSEEDLLEALGPLVQGLGYSIVEIHSTRIRGTTHVNMAIHRPDGVTVDGCAEVSRTILPRMEILYDTQDIYLEVASPGIDRKLKHPREYVIFKGKGVQIHLKDGKTVLRGLIGESHADAVTLIEESGQVDVLYEQIQKARLDDTQEVK